jgi:hypothetical protein
MSCASRRRSAPGRPSASLLLKRLGVYPRQNGLAPALREIGRIERTLFMLDWLDLPGLRWQATVELNKGEARNALARYWAQSVYTNTVTLAAVLFLNPQRHVFNPIFGN